MVNSDMQTAGKEKSVGQMAVLLLSDVKPEYRLWGWSRIVMGPQALRHVPGLLFCKLLGSGHNGGFGLRPSASRQGLFALFDSAQAASDFMEYHFGTTIHVPVPSDTSWGPSMYVEDPIDLERETLTRVRTAIREWFMDSYTPSFIQE